MLVKTLEKLPGGRALVFAIPIACLVLGKLFLDDETITQIGNVTSLALCLAMLWIYRESPLIFMQETESASTQWWSLGTFSLVVVTVVNIGHSQWLRSFDIPVDPDSFFFSVIRIGYAFAFGCLFIAPQARESVIPPRGWWWLLAITAAATLGTIVATRVF